jgi:23S rRNA pseudouridine1911/1915/1917 synthase
VAEAGPQHEGAEFELVVGSDEAGERLDRLLGEPLGSRAQAVRSIDAGLVQVDGKPVRKRHILSAGERITVLAGRGGASSLGRDSGDHTAATAELPGSGEAGPSPPFTIAYEDEYLLVVDKPAGVVVHPGRGHWTGTLAQALSGRAAGGEEGHRAGIVHRLDRDTSGLLVVAKSDAVHRALRALLAKRALRREYLALVEGIPEARTGTIEAPIGRDRRDRVMMSLDTDTPRDARTHFEVVEAIGLVSLLRIVLDTGRTHQIRVHMQAIGHPVCGDQTYGGSGRFGLERQFLHAARLTFEHPMTGALVDLSSALPPDLQRALDRARA